MSWIIIKKAFLAWWLVFSGDAKEHSNVSELIVVSHLRQAAANVNPSWRSRYGTCVPSGKSPFQLRRGFHSRSTLHLHQHQEGLLLWQFQDHTDCILFPECLSASVSFLWHSMYDVPSTVPWQTAVCILCRIHLEGQYIRHYCSHTS